MTAEKVVEQARAWLGRREDDGSFKEVIDVYNAHKPLAQGYKMGYAEPWCATFVSAVAIKCGCTDIIPTECSCQRQIGLFQKLGEWVEDDSRTPAPGDIIYYDWQDSGNGDNAGLPDHVGIVESIDAGKICVIEGNIEDKVGRRYININGKFIRGYGVPRYEKSESEEKEMRYFKLMEEMNFRQTPNGVKIGVIPAGTIIAGTQFATNNGIEWLYTDYSGQKGYVAVLPESKNYAVEIEQSPQATSPDYEKLYAEEKGRADALQTKLDKIKKILN